MNKLILTGRRFGRLVVSEEDGRDSKKRLRWKCVCDCGIQKTIASTNLISGHTRSCGCMNLEMVKERSTTHGQGRAGKQTPEYRAWSLMKSRCLNPNDARFIEYGGRGIRVCKRWMQFENFFNDMGKKPSSSHSLDRKETNGNYNPANCRWATAVEQQNNKRNNHLITVNGVTKTMRMWEVEMGYRPGLIQVRVVTHGWNEQRAVLQIPRKSPSK